MTTVHILNGPNLNRLGSRDPGIYGHETLDDVGIRCAALVESRGHALDLRQTNHEGVLIDWVQEIGEAFAAGDSLGIVMNPGALAHTSVALRDAVDDSPAPVIEVHISNLHSREQFRHHSHLSEVAAGVLAGFGTFGYELGIHGLLARSAAVTGSPVSDPRP